MLNLKTSLLATSATAAIASVGLYWINFIDRPAVAYLADGHITRHASQDMLTCADARLHSWGDDDAAHTWAACQDWLGSYGSLDEFNTDFNLVGGLGLLSGLAFFGLIATSITEKKPVKVTRGPKRRVGAQARKIMREVSRKECRRSGKGINFPPGIVMSRDRESRHTMITGGVGSGKTQTMRHMILEAMRRGDKLMVLDTKGDMTAGLPGGIVLLAPQDARSAAWDVATDCVSKQDARELAARFIPKSDDPMWSEAAREIFVTCVASLQAEKPKAWTWADLHSRAIMEPEVLLGFSRKYNPAASQFLADPTSKTSMSILTTFKAHLSTIEALAQAWGKNGDKAFPVSRWLHETEGTVPIVLQRDGRYPKLSNAWISGLLGILSSHVGSPSFAESDERRVWLFLDEFPQLEQMEDFSALMDLGRSKGVCIVMSAQDTSQIRIRYGRDRTSSWLSMVGTHIVSRLNVGDGAEDVSRAIGMQEVEVPVTSTGHSGGRHSKSISVQTRQRPVITASEISSQLGPHSNGVRVMFIGVGEEIHIVDIPYEPFDEERKAHVPAAWTKSGSDRVPTPDPEATPPSGGDKTRLTPADLARIRARAKDDKS